MSNGIKKVHLVYFSPSGSSEKVIKKIASAIKDVPVETHDLLTSASRKKEYDFGSGDLVFFCTMTASLVLTKFDEIFGCLHGNGAPFAGVVTFANTLFMKDILLEEIKAYAEKQGFKVAALGAFPASHTLASALGSEGRPNSEDEKLMLGFGQRVYEKVSGGDYVLHGKIGENTSEADADKIASYRSVENGHSTFPPAYKAKAISDACIKCKTCVRHCPVDAIDIENKTFDLDKCMGCWGCINRCPKHAITSTSPEITELLKNYSGMVKMPFDAETIL